MAYQSFFYNSKNGDRKYRAEAMAALMAALVKNGVYADPADNCMVMSAGGSMKVKILNGRLWINGYCTVIESPEQLTVPAADVTHPRIDRVVARLDLTQRYTVFDIVKGTAAETPVAPELTRTENVYELGLATIYVDAGVTEITDAEITDTRYNSDVCGIVTGVIEQIDAGNLFVQYNSQWQKFKGKLREDPAAELYQSIESMQEYSYALCPHNRRIEILTSQNWTVPEGVTSVDVFLVGGGGGGCFASHSNTPNAGGGGGYTKLFKNLSVTPGDIIPIIIGAGGNGGHTNDTATVTDGGSTSFGTLASVEGGKAPKGNNWYSQLGEGGSGGGYSNSVGSNYYPTPGGRNGSNGCGTNTAENGRVLIAKGQGEPTTDPYSGITYAPGGDVLNENVSTGWFPILPQSIIGGGGNSALSSLNVSDGMPGICVIYYTVEEV